jgi:hypothetical protein
MHGTRCRTAATGRGLEYRPAIHIVARRGRPAARQPGSTEMGNKRRIRASKPPSHSRKEFDMKQFKLWQSLATALLGVWLMVSPWLLHFAESAIARDNAVLAGLVALVIGIWAVAREKDWAVPGRDHVAG